MVVGRVPAVAGSPHPGERRGMALTELEAQTKEEDAVVFGEPANIAPVSDQRYAPAFPGFDCVGREGIQECPFTSYVDQKGLSTLGQHQEAAARIAAPSPDCGCPGVGLVYMDASLGVKVDVQAGEGEAGELSLDPASEGLGEPGLA